jgi:hypothetical protein
MSKLQEFSDMQELEFYAAVSDIKNAIAKFGPDVITVALFDNQVSEGLNLTMLATDDTMVIH